MYTKTNWVARVGTALNRFLKTNETSTEVELTNDPTGVTTAGTPFTVANMNKIEEGIYDAHVGLDNNGLIDNTRINQDVRTTASPTFANATIAGHNIDSELDTLNGRVNQGVKTTDSPTFATVNTGQGANELYPMNQGVRTTDSPTFATINTGPGATEVHLMNQNLRTTDSVHFANLNPPVDNNDATPPTIGIGGFTFAAAGSESAILAPSGGTHMYLRMTSSGTIWGCGRIAGGSATAAGTGTGTDYAFFWRLA